MAEAKGRVGCQDLSPEGLVVAPGSGRLPELPRKVACVGSERCALLLRLGSGVVELLRLVLKLLPFYHLSCSGVSRLWPA